MSKRKLTPLNVETIFQRRLNKKICGIILNGVFSFRAGLYHDANCKDNVLDNAWDQYTTLGKKGMEKDQILAQNRADRLKRCLGMSAKKAADAASKTSTEEKKKLGL